MWLLLIFFIFTCYSQCFVEMTNRSSTTVYYNQTLDVYDDSCISNDDLFLITDSTITCTVSNSFTSTNFNLDLSGFSGSYTEFNMDFNQSTPRDLKNIQIVPQIDYFSEISVNFYLKYINDYTNIYIGCFDNESDDCNSISKSNITSFDKSFTVFCDSNQSDLIIQLIMKYDNSKNFNGYPYLFFESYSELKLNLIFENDVTSSNSDGTYYLFTGKNINETYLPNIAKSVCSRTDTNRYLLFDENITPYTNCSCWTKYNNKKMDQSTIFNYPDCNYNSSMFDLILPSSSTTYSLSDDLLEWYSIQFTAQNQSIQIDNGKKLTIDELNINQNDISFNEEVYVKNLTISTIGCSFDTLNFDNIDTTAIEDNTIILYFDDSATNFDSFGLLECEVKIDYNYYYYSSNTQKGNVALIKTEKSNCYCYYSNNEFMDDDGYCDGMKLNENNPYTLVLESTNYTLNSDEYWYSIQSYLQYQQDTSEINIYGNYTTTIQNCNFENVIVNIEDSLNCSSLSIGNSAKITVNGNLYCTTIEISSSPELIVKGTLEVEMLVYQGYSSKYGIDNLNENGIIQSYGNVIIHSLVLFSTSDECFELISTTSSISIPENTYGGMGYASYSLLSQNHLLRICPFTSTFNYEVECTTIGNTFEYTSFTAIHCPCIDVNCTINVNTTESDSRNIEFSGTFNILTDSVIIISNETSTFKTNIDVQNVTSIIIGEDSIGFEKNSLKSSTSTIKTVNNGLCQVLIVEYNDASCLICNGSITEDGLCIAYTNVIEHCLITNDKLCEECYEGYESKGSYCYECPSNCLRCYNGECINCDTNYYINSTGKCESINNPIISIENNKTLKCSDGYYSNGECIQCDDNNCITCNSSQCLTCNNSIVLSNGSCKSLISNNGEEIMSNYGVIDCINGYYSNNSQCIDCSLTFDNCELCNINGCLNCNSGYVLLNDNTCSLNTNCLNIDDSICLSCNDKGSWFNGNECIECGDNCKNCINGYCIECNDGYILQSENTCIENEYPDNCITLNYYETCQRCSDGYYLNNNLCNECNSTCVTCHNLTYCFSCNDGYMLNDNNECVDMSESNANCKTAIPGSSGGCAICNDGYYRDQTSCLSCISNCNKCNNGESCLSCESNYFLLNDASECISYDDLTNCETKTQSGCTNCINDSYYLNNQYCISCSDITENCNTCNNNRECLTCQNDHILINYGCIDYQLIDNCKESSDSKCTSCSFWHTLNEDQTGCDTKAVWWVIVLIILLILIILIGICASILYVIKLILDWKKQQKQRKQTTIFDISRSNVQFIPTNNKDVVINKGEILFNDECEEIGVNEQTRDLICVGNTSKHAIKVQFSVKDGCDKYEIRTNPQLITIPKGKAVEFEIFIKPLCTCKINDQIMLISVDLSKGKTITTPITINTITIMTTRLDYSELIENVKLGEGSFGIVYKGTFRGNQVAIKKLKEAQDNPDSIGEFNKEVSMLDKFRNDYIVHFYGAVFIPNKICMVTEYAQYGSLQDLMNKRKKEPIEESMKMKILLDCSKGISYLHSNGILHRDIKPGNFLVLSLENDVQVNAKLTDFGSSRNINMLMTNMTFTKGIGTPVYMAPEALKQNKYKKSADIYSLAITIYETIIWDEAYPKSQFKFPWKIANFVANGERLPKPDKMNESIYLLIDNCWKQDPKERYSTDQIISIFEEMN